MVLTDLGVWCGGCVQVQQTREGKGDEGRTFLGQFHWGSPANPVAYSTYQSTQRPQMAGWIPGPGYRPSCPPVSLGLRALQVLGTHEVPRFALVNACPGVAAGAGPSEKGTLKQPRCAREVHQTCLSGRGRSSVRAWRAAVRSVATWVELLAENLSFLASPKVDGVWRSGQQEWEGLQAGRDTHGCAAFAASELRTVRLCARERQPKHALHPLLSISRRY